MIYIDFKGGVMTDTQECFCKHAYGPEANTAQKKIRDIQFIVKKAVVSDHPINDVPNELYDQLVKFYRYLDNAIEVADKIGKIVQPTEQNTSTHIPIPQQKFI